MKSKKMIWLVVSLVCVIACAACIFFIYHYVKGLEEDQKSFDELKQDAFVTEEPLQTEEVQASATQQPAVEIPVDFATLQQQNSDIYAWITVPGTLVDYPVVQSPTNDFFYLDHGINGESSAAGCIYSESMNAKDFTDPQTVLYGHNMKNDTMFGSLHSYEDKAFFDANRTVYVYTPTQKLTYRIFAAYPTGNEHLLNTVDTKNPQAFAAYLEKVRDNRAMNAFIDKEVKVDATDCVLTLSTCIGVNNSGQRYVVQAVLVQREQ